MIALLEEKYSTIWRSARRTSTRYLIVWCALAVGVTSAWPGNRALALEATPQIFLDTQAYSRLIEDGDFLNRNAMSVQDIQNFLASQGSYLASAPSDQLGDEAGGRSAAQIIWDAAQGNVGSASGSWGGGVITIGPATGTISPRAIIITLQKEQSLVTIGDYQPNRLRAAMGYGCPDGGGCNPAYYGFTKQVNFGAAQLRFNYERAQGHGYSDYQVNQTKSMSYNFGAGGPNGIVTVVYTNRATASLYRYTPHITYGNYNFWRLSRTWFGMSVGGGSGANVNDYSAVSLNTYGTTIKISGTKESASTVHIGSIQVGSSGSTSWSYQFTPSVGRNNYVFEYRASGGGTQGTKTVTIERRKPGDIDGSGRVDLADLSLISNGWGVTIVGEDWRNLNPDVDNEINLLDLSIFANNWEG